MLTEAIALKLIMPMGGSAPGSGTDHMYQFGDVLALTALRRLRDVGYPRSKSAAFLALLARTKPATNLRGFGLLSPDGEFTVGGTRALMLKMSSETTGSWVVLNLTLLREFVNAGIAECTIVTLPRRGRKRGQLVRRKRMASD